MESSTINSEERINSKLSIDYDSDTKPVHPIPNTDSIWNPYFTAGLETKNDLLFGVPQKMPIIWTITYSLFDKRDEKPLTRHY